MKLTKFIHCRALGLFSLIIIVTCLTGAEPDPVSRFAFGSCADQSRAQTIWHQVLEVDPQLWIWTGDNIYADTEDMLVMWEKYQKLLQQPGYAELLSRNIPILATWDDHDYGLNDGGCEYEMRKESRDLFLKFFKVPKSSPRWQRDGVFNSKIIGPQNKQIQFILLDTRYNRSPLCKEVSPDGELITFLPNPDPSATMLGEDQWKWLEGELQKPAQVRFIISSIQLIPTGHRFEKWANLPLERKRFLDLLRDSKAEGVIILSGDRHHAELSVLPRKNSYPLLELTASGINKKQPMNEDGEYPVDSNAYRIGDEFHEYHFGLVQIDWNMADPRITIEVVDNKGNRPIHHSIRLSELK